MPIIDAFKPYEILHLRTKDCPMNIRTYFAASSLSVCALAGALATTAVPASAQISNFPVVIAVRNNSDRESWVDIAKGYKVTPGWRIQTAFCLKPGQAKNFDTVFSPLGGPEVRVRAEVKKGDCTSGNVTMVSTHMDTPIGGRASAVQELQSFVRGTNNSYSITIDKR
jgi:hypothetical protein